MGSTMLRENPLVVVSHVCRVSLGIDLGCPDGLMPQQVLHDQGTRLPRDECVIEYVVKGGDQGWTQSTEMFCTVSRE